MGDWKIELDALIKETTAFASIVGDNIGRERPAPREMVQRILLKTGEARDVWMHAPWDEAKALQLLDQHCGSAARI